MDVTLYQPDIAQNLGAIMRSCACFDVALSVIEPCGFPLTARGIRKAAMDYGAPDALTRHQNWEAFQNRGESAGKNRGRTVLFTTKGATPLPDFKFQANDTLLFGRESAGVPDHVHTAADARVVIPIAAGARSFNLSNSVAIALFEALRQTGALPA
ncbi:tRNA (cytidine(34)-2'-O)-methyltransferase [Fretibacter rubidus]|uniref:tRNA (cytidine(34)-2'-O)-methyltransferase n=1 Tax=Fretibacter rubidus TaxID=570162 RepID=UPI00352A3FE4